MKKKEKGYINQNGIKISGDIAIQYNKIHTWKLYFPIQILIAVIVTFVTTIIAESFIETGSSVPMLFLFSLLSSVSFGILKCKNIAVKIFGMVSSLILIAYQIFNIQKIKDGLIYVAADYLSKAKLIEHNSHIENISSIKYDDAISSFYFALIVFIAFWVCVSCVYRTDFALLFIFTFPIVELGLYWGWDVSIPALITLVVCWILTLAIQLINHNTNKAGKNNIFAIHEKKKTFYLTSDKEKRSFFTVFTPFVCVITVFAFLCTAVFSLLTGFSRPKSFDAYRKEISQSVSNFTFKDIGTTLSNYDGGLNLFKPKAVGGINGGVLGTNSEIQFNNTTALKITTDKFSDMMYLKGYVAGIYSNNCWTPVNAENENFVQMLKNDNLITQDISYDVLSKTQSDTKTIDIMVKGASKKYVYAPYFSNYQGIKNSNGKNVIPTEEGLVTPVSKSYSVSFYDYNISTFDNPDLFSNESDGITMYDEFVHNNYMAYNKSDALQNAYSEIINRYLQSDNQFEENEYGSYSYSDVYNAIKSYFDDNFKYTLSPGNTPEGEDFIDYFLTEQKKGYCSYFASAGVELLRMFGFPARYVEGYVVLPSQQLEDDNNKFSVTVKDKSAHAWVEVYFDGFGWAPAEFTPGYNNDNPNLSETEKHPKIKNNTDISKSETSSQAETVQTTTTKNTTHSSSSSVELNTSSSTSSKDESSSNSDLSNTDNKSGNIYCLELVVILIACIIIFLLIRRHYLLDIMEKECNQSDTEKQAKAIFKYTIKYFTLVGIKINGNYSDLEVCKLILSECEKQKINIASSEFNEFCNIAVKADMSKNNISADEIDLLKNVMKNVSEEIKNHLSPISKLKAKFILCLF